MRTLKLLLLTVAVVSSCSDDSDINPKEGIIFGEVYGQCVGDCRRLFLITPQGLFEDSDMDTGFGKWENTTFNHQLPQDKFDLAKVLLDTPGKLMENDDEIGEQFLADFDYYFRVTNSQGSRTVIFDKIKSGTNSEINQYFDNLIEINRALTE